MKVLFQLVITMFLAGFLLVFFSDCTRRERLFKYMGTLLMVPAVTIAMASLFVGVWSM